MCWLICLPPADVSFYAVVWALLHLLLLWQFGGPIHGPKFRLVLRILLWAAFCWVSRLMCRITLHVVSFPLLAALVPFVRSYSAALRGHIIERRGSTPCCSGLGAHVNVCWDGASRWSQMLSALVPANRLPKLMSWILPTSSVQVDPLGYSCTSGTRVSQRNFVHGGGVRSSINGRLLAPYIFDGNNIDGWNHREFAFEYQCKKTEVRTVLERHKNCLAVDIPTSKILDVLGREDILRLSKLHDVWVPTRTKADKCREMFLNHKCSECDSVVSVFCNISADSTGWTDPNAKPLAQHGRFRKPKKPPPTPARLVYDALMKKRAVYKLKTHRKRKRGMLKDTSFPPRPLNIKAAHRIITAHCKTGSRLRGVRIFDADQTVD
ncbi:hypothetical protein DFH06DRAFT_1121399 [Mycena polygramma]|nr:hypothetical protein DFH06DRAFT_1121399 [Mycena polygramma]